MVTQKVAALEGAVLGSVVTRVELENGVRPEENVMALNRTFQSLC
jgi:hypothetical protein